MARPGYAVNCWLGQYDFTKTPPTYHVKVPSHYVIATFQLDGSLMLESPDYFFRVREIGRLRQTMVLINPRRACAARVTVLLLCVCLSVCLSVCLWSFQLTLRWLFRS